MRTNGQTRTYSNSSTVKTPAEIERQIELTRARMSNTIEAIKKDLSPGQVIDHALHYFKDGKAGEAAGNMASSVASSVGGVVKTNPLPAAVIGAGLAWLFVSTSRAKRASAEMPSSFTRDASLPGIDTTSSFAPEFSSGGVSDKAKGFAHRAADSAKSKGVAVKERAQHISHGAAEKAHLASVKAQETARRAKEGTVRGYEAQPLVVGAIAIGVGALLGSLLPSTSRENQMMGKKRDDLMKKADEMSAGLLGKAKEKVDSGVQMVKERMEKSSGMLQGEQLAGAPSSTFESDLAPTEPYGVMTTTSTSIQTAPLPVPEEILQGSSSGSFGGGFDPTQSSASEREIEGMEPASIPPKNRGPGI